jgi:hypothetical protein
MATPATDFSDCANHKPKIENRKSKIENRKSKIENRKSKIENRTPHYMLRVKLRKGTRFARSFMSELKLRPPKREILRFAQDDGRI